MRMRKPSWAFLRVLRVRHLKSDRQCREILYTQEENDETQEKSNLNRRDVRPRADAAGRKMERSTGKKWEREKIQQTVPSVVLYVFSLSFSWLCGSAVFLAAAPEAADNLNEVSSSISLLQCLCHGRQSCTPPSVCGVMTLFAHSFRQFYQWQWAATILKEIVPVAWRMFRDLSSMKLISISNSSALHSLTGSFTNDWAAIFYSWHG